MTDTPPTAEKALEALSVHLHTGGQCWSEKKGGGMCTRRAGHDGAHSNWSGGEWLNGPEYEKRPSSWTPTLLAIVDLAWASGGSS